MFRVFFLVFLASCTLVSCSNPTAMFASPTPTPTCGQQFVGYNKLIQPILQEWDDAAKLANNTSRISLSPQIESMQAIRRRMSALEHAPCLDAVHSAVTDGMGHDIDTFIAFMGQNDYDQGIAQREAKQSWNKAFALMDEVTGVTANTQPNPLDSMVVDSFIPSPLTIMPTDMNWNLLGGSPRNTTAEKYYAVNSSGTSGDVGFIALLRYEVDDVVEIAYSGVLKGIQAGGSNALSVESLGPRGRELTEIDTFVRSSVVFTSCDTVVFMVMPLGRDATRLIAESINQRLTGTCKE